jgi:hypothetical protein
MVTEAEAFCLSCGVARNRGSKCDYCGRLYVSAAKAAAGTAPLRSLTSKYKLKKKRGETVISWRWKNKSSWFLIPFSFVWIGMALSIGGGELFFSDPLATFPVPMIPVLIGIALLINAIVKLINGTSIHVSRQSLAIRHYPVPWRRNVRYPASDIQQVFVSRVQRSNNERTWHAPVLQLITHSGTRQALLSGSSEAQFADFESLRYEILEALDIEPMPVAGEYQAGNK